MLITSGDATILESGTVIIFDTKPLTFSLTVDKLQFKIQFVFKYTDRQEPTVLCDLHEETHIFTVIDSNSRQTGMGLASPMKLARIDTTEVYFTFRLTSIENRLYQVAYSFFSKQSEGNNSCCK